LITAAYLDLEISDFVPGSKSEGFSWISVAGYAGSGVPDANNAVLETPLLSDRIASALGAISFSLDVRKLDAIRAQSDYLGLVTRGLPSQFPSSFYASEQASIGEGHHPPTLRLDYITVPEPAGLLLALLTTVFIAFQREIHAFAG
jgi:hypothetical protein